MAAKKRGEEEKNEESVCLIPWVDEVDLMK